jgi:hypothetical protein
MAVLAEAVVVLALSLLVEVVKAVSVAAAVVPMILADLHPKVALGVTAVAAALAALPTA